MAKVLCFGELLLRMSPVLDREWIHNSSMPVFIGGAELNAAHALAKWNVPVRYFTALPDHYLSREILQELEAKKIDVSKVLFSGNRIGVYYLPQGVDLKNAGVIYDRANSSFAELLPQSINWDEILQDISWLHFSAICPALNANAAIICEEVLKAASAKKITISVDLNYRAKLWQYGKRPIDIMPHLVEYCNVVMGNLWAVETMLGIPSPVRESAGKSTEELVAAAGTSMGEIHKRYPRVTDIAYTFRLEKTYFGVMQHGHEQVISKSRALENIIDKVGSGDCFMAGLIFGLYNRNAPQDIIDFASTAAVSKLSEIGDATRRTEAEIRGLMKENINA
jgi:2-dehydro-3-deoxygluconokinase